MNPVRWQPTTETELQQGIDDGLLEETHYLDVKREVGKTDGERKETARDLASFAIHGGALIVGVEEDKPNRRWSRARHPLNDLVERVELIAANRIDPPLYIRVTEIPSDDDPQEGYLFIEVPPSSQAPHMVDGTYFGRGEKTRRKLRDPEVSGLHAARADLEVRIEDLLTREIARDPIKPDDRQCGHLYLVAQPVNAGKRVARASARGNGNDIWQLIERTDASLSQSLTATSPSIVQASTWVSRAEGGARCSSSLRSARVYDGKTADHEARMVDYEFRDDGGIRVLVGGFARTIERENGYLDPIILDSLAVAYATRLVVWSSGLAAMHEYRGSWMLGIASAGLHGRRAWRTDPWFEPPRYNEDEYRAATTATALEMTERPREVVERLVGSLLHTLGTYDGFKEYLEYGS